MHDGTNIKEYFVSGGFAVIQAGSADVTAVEAVPLDQLDVAAIGPGTRARAAAELDATVRGANGLCVVTWVVLV